MKILKTALLSTCLLAAWPLQAQNFTFSTIAGGTQGAGGGTNGDAQFYDPTGVAVDGNGNLYIADQKNDLIRKITPSGTNWIVTTIAGSGAQGSLDGTNAGARFSSPTGIALDNATNLYVSDQFNYTIRKITPLGTNWVVTTIAGEANVSGARDGANTNARFFNPTGVALDNAGNIFVADEFNNAVRKMTPSGTNWIVSTIAGGSMGSADGTNTGAEFWGPVGVAVDANDRVFVADQFNNMIRLLTPSGTNWIVTTIAGQLNSGASNGLGTNAQFNTPVGVALGTNGDVYVADLFNDAIREMTPSGSNWLVSTIGGGSQGTNNGTGTNARFFFPIGIAADAYGGLFVADSENNSIRQGLSGSSAPQTGSLEIVLTPSNAVAAGAEWQLLGGPLQESGTTISALTPGVYTVAFAPNAGYLTPGDQTVTVTARQTAMVVVNYITASNFTILLDASPAAEGTVEGGGAFVAGGTNILTATPDSGFEFIGWAGEATGTNNPLTVKLNTNLNITACFAASGSMTLTVLTNGDGVVSPNLNGKALKAGRRYTLSATAKNGNVFSNWTGSITTNRNPLAIMMKSSLVLQANFIPNPFLPVKGTYNGLFTATNGVTEQTAGMLRGLTVGQNGVYSGAVFINGGSHTVGGSFNLSGQATNRISRPASQGGPLMVAMTLHWNDSPPQLTGTVSGTMSGTPWVANLLADLASHELPSGEYTMLIPPDTNNAPPDSSPGGDGYALITNNAGAVRIAGALADGTTFGQSVTVSRDGYVAVCASLYANKGLLLGWINLASTNMPGVGLTWIQPERQSGLYAIGFTNILLTNQILLSPWTNPPANIDLLTNLSILSTISETNTPIPVATVAPGVVTGASVSGSISPKTGFLKLMIGAGTSMVTGYGAVLLNQTNGGGYFLTTSNAQAILLSP